MSKLLIAHSSIIAALYLPLGGESPRVVSSDETLSFAARVSDGDREASLQR